MYICILKSLNLLSCRYFGKKASNKKGEGNFVISKPPRMERSAKNPFFKKGKAGTHKMHVRFPFCVCVCDITRNKMKYISVNIESKQSTTRRQY